jgi:hypothetical protein
MSNTNFNQDDKIGNEAPRLEPWLAVMLLAIVPMLAALLLSRELVLHLASVSAILFAAAIGMLIVQERRKR